MNVITLLPRVEVFKTGVQHSGLAEQVIQKLLARFPFYGINFDLQDCDRILRVEGDGIDSAQVIALLNDLGLECSILED